MLLLIYLQNKVNIQNYTLQKYQCDVKNEVNMDSYQQTIACLQKKVEKNYFENDYTPYTNDIKEAVKSIQPKMTDIIDKVNGSPDIKRGEVYNWKDSINLENIYLKLSKDGLNRVTSTLHPTIC